MFCILLQPVLNSYDHSVEQHEHTVEQWKYLMYQEVKEYEAQNLLSQNGILATEWLEKNTMKN